MSGSSRVKIPYVSLVAIDHPCLHRQLDNLAVRIIEQGIRLKSLDDFGAEIAMITKIRNYGGMTTSNKSHHRSSASRRPRQQRRQRQRRRYHCHDSESDDGNTVATARDNAQMEQQHCSSSTEGPLDRQTPQQKWQFEAQSALTASATTTAAANSGDAGESRNYSCTDSSDVEYL